MSRKYRTIKPEVILEDERAADLSDAAWRLWVAVRTLADDWGTFRAGTKYLAAQVWQDTGRARKVDGYLRELADAGKIVRFSADGQPFGSIAGWDAEQRVDNRSQRTRLPSPPEQSRDVEPDSAADSPKSPRFSRSRGDLPEVAARARARAIRPPEGDTDTDSDPEGEGDARARDPGAAPEPAKPQPRPTDERLAMAFAKGVDDSGEGMIAPPLDYQNRQRLILAVETHCKGADVDAAVAWLREQARAYAAAADAFNRRRGFPVSGFVEWLNGKRAAKPGLQPAARGGSDWTSRNPNVITIGAEAPGRREGPHG